MAHDIRWIQRFQNYIKALKRLSDAVELADERALSDLKTQGLIQVFECTQELALKLLKDYLEYQGITNLIGSKDAVRSAFKNGLIENGDAWMTMIPDRNSSSHTYELNVAEEIAENIFTVYHSEFTKLAARFNTILETSLDD